MTLCVVWRNSIQFSNCISLLFSARKSLPRFVSLRGSARTRRRALVVRLALLRAALRRRVVPSYQSPHRLSTPTTAARAVSRRGLFGAGYGRERAEATGSAKGNRPDISASDPRPCVGDQRIRILARWWKSSLKAFWIRRTGVDGKT